VQQLLTELGADFMVPIDKDYDSFGNFTDITPDPITENVTSVCGALNGKFNLFGEAVSLVRGPDSSGDEITVICKSPWRG
jgi:hypothetical protein